MDAARTHAQQRQGSGRVSKQVKQLDRVIIRFAGDSGDGMQLTGDRFTQESAVFGNDLVTLPNFPAEIRAPQGTLPGVSSFQVHFADHDILTAGDAPDVLVAMNPAALKANLADLPKGAQIIVDTHDFTGRNLTKAGYDVNPLDSLDDGGVGGELGRVRRLPARPDRDDRRGGQGVRALPQGRRPREEHVRARAAVLDVRTPDRVHDRVPGEAVREGRRHPRRQHHGVQVRLELRRDHRDVRGPVRGQAGADGARAPTATSPATSPSPTAWSPAGVQSGLPIFLGSYPITPASDILHELSKHKSFGVTTLQAEDEIAGIGAAIGAAFSGSLGVTTTSGPGHRAEVGVDRPGRDDRAAAAGDRRTARRPVHRPARPRPSRPT